MRRDYRILVIGDDQQRMRDLTVILDFMGEPTQGADFSNWQTSAGSPDDLLTIIISDRLKADELKSFLSDIAAWNQKTPVILYAEEGTFESLGDDLKHQVLGEIAEPLRYSQVMETIHRCQIAQEHNPDVNNQGVNRPLALFRSLVGTNKGIVHARKMIEKVAPSDANVLVLGESGTGKEVVARNIHYHSPRRDKPFIPVNCGAIPADLLESELFGHEKGAFTGAINSRQGRFELAEGGTLFLDEIGDMPLPMQVKLLRVLQEHTFERVGSNKSIKSDVRIVAATHRNLEKEIAEGRFREDLFYRLNVFPIEIPSLRDRIEDLPVLLNELVSRIEGQQRAGVRFLPRAVAALSRYAWPGNVRELANLVERMAILYPSGMIDIKDLPPKFLAGQDVQDLETIETDELAAFEQASSVAEDLPLGAVPYLPADGIDLKEHLIKTERRLIEKALEESGGVVARAADFLKMRRTTLVEKMRKYGMQRVQTANTSGQQH